MVQVSKELFALLYLLELSESEVLEGKTYTREQLLKEIENDK